MTNITQCDIERITEQLQTLSCDDFNIENSLFFAVDETSKDSKDWALERFTTRYGERHADFVKKFFTSDKSDIQVAANGADYSVYYVHNITRAVIEDHDYRTSEVEDLVCKSGYNLSIDDYATALNDLEKYLSEESHICPTGEFSEYILSEPDFVEEHANLTWNVNKKPGARWVVIETEENEI